MISRQERAVKILAIEHEVPGSTDDAFQPHLKAEARELVQAGTIRETYFDRDAHVAVLMLECDDVADASIVLDTLPLVRAGLITFELRPLIPYSGYSRLFTESD